MVICLERGADLHMAQQMSLLLTGSCFSKIQIGFAFLVAAHLGSPRQRAVKRMCVCVCVISVSFVAEFFHFISVYTVLASSHAVFEPPTENRRQPPGRPCAIWMKNEHDDLSSLDLGIHKPHEARDLAQNRPLWRLMSLHSTTHS